MSITVTFDNGQQVAVPFDTYPDGTFYTKWRVPPGMSAVTIGCYSTNPNDVLKAVALGTAILERAKGATYDGKVNLFIPFLPGGRQDRLNDQGDYLWTSKTIAGLINSVFFSKVYTVDAHSRASIDYVQRVRKVPVTSFLDKAFIPHVDGIIAPDKGAAERASAVANYLDVPVLQAGKERDVETGRLTKFVPPEEDMKDGGSYLIVDDICDGGGTFMGLANAILDVPGNKRYSPCLGLLVTHGLFTNPLMFADMKSTFDNGIYTVFNWGGADVTHAFGKLPKD